MENMIAKMEQEKFCESFKNKLVAEWKEAEQTGYPIRYYADRGSLVVNGLAIANGIGDGQFYIYIVDSVNPNYEERIKGFEQTGIDFFNDTEIKIRIYDCLPESEFKCEFSPFRWAELLRNDEGDFIIAFHN